MSTFAFDIRTLSFLLVVTGVLYFLGLLLFGTIQKEFKGFYFIAAAVFSITAGFLLISLRGILSDFITIILANIAVISGIVFYYEGIRRFLSKATRFHPLSIFFVVLGFFLFLYFTYWTPSVNARIVIVSAIHVTISVLCVRELLRDLHVSLRIPRLFTAFVFAADGAFEFFRLVSTINTGPIQSLFSAGNTTALIIISAIFLITGTAFGFIWIVSKKLENKLTRQATVDPLTNVLNRRGVEMLASQEFEKLKRVKNGLAVMMLDIDHFKQVNDRYGHSVGDHILSGLAELTQKCLRPYDIFGRIGGEEFIILFPSTKLEQAQEIGERIRRLIEEHVFRIGTDEVQITASFGITNHIPENATLDNVIPFADEALYQSKKQGRNRVSSFTQVGEEIEQ